MSALVSPVHDERSALLGYLAHQRHMIRVTAHGLTDEQARAPPTVSALSVGGLVKHVASMERWWIDLVEQGAVASAGDYESQFRLAPGETLAGVLSGYDEVARRTEAVLDGITDLGRPVPVPHEVPWFPADVEAWSVRWVLLHLIEETARHAGHADIVREVVDGATAYPLLAAVEQWPATPWLQPWRPAD
ncbi:DinB family protein [Micromonospora sp. CPCC 206060]|uniref:DinB family protein n=1 Tax=Micromonospora sp. CPCC 206060 TaxID=3122406 RepID=UPI002FEE83FB